MPFISLTNRSTSTLIDLVLIFMEKREITVFIQKYEWVSYYGNLEVRHNFKYQNK